MLYKSIVAFKVNFVRLILSQGIRTCGETQTPVVVIGIVGIIKYDNNPGRVRIGLNIVLSLSRQTK